MKFKNIFLFSLLATASLHAGELHDAATNGDLEEVRSLLDAGAQVDEKDAYVTTALHRATGRGHIEIVKLLLDRGASVDARAEYGRTALHWAVRHGQTAIARLLLDRGASVDGKDNNGQTTLVQVIFAGQTEIAEIAQLLLDRGASVYARDWLGWTPLHVCAARKGQTETAQLLVYHATLKGIREELVEAREYGQTAAEMAKIRGFQEIYELLTDENQQRKVIEQVHKKETKRKKAQFLEKLKANGLTPELYLRQRALTGRVRLR